MEDFELTLYDRLEMIKTTINTYGEGNFYISFSGGKDSQVLSVMIDEAIPNNRIPRVFCNTGIEYTAIVKHVKKLAEVDNRFVVYNNCKNITNTLKKVGYPFKSKEHSKYVFEYQRHGMRPYMERYLKGDKFNACPKKLAYQFTEENKLKISDKCCYEFKKSLLHKWEKENKKSIAILGLRKSEGGLRSMHNGCVMFNDKKLIKFKPLNPISDEFEEWYINTRNIQLCELYYPPYNMTRTGCKGCPFNLRLKEDLEMMRLLLPNERKQCEILWKPVYQEYRRLNYRLTSNEQLTLFSLDEIEKEG